MISALSDAAEPSPAGRGDEAEKSLSALAYERVLDLIMSGAAKPGAFFTERKLADALSMSRTPLRDALLMLEQEGLLTRLATRGVQVATMRIEDFVDTLSVRRLLEPEAARIAAGRIPAETLDTLRIRFEQLQAQARSGRAADRQAVRAADDQLHSTIGAAAGNGKLAAIVETLRRQTLVFDLRSLPERFDDTCCEHLAIVAALAADGEAAAAAMRAHLDAVRASIVARLARL